MRISASGIRRPLRNWFLLANFPSDREIVLLCRSNIFFRSQFFFWRYALEPVLAQETITQEELVRRTQELFDAVVPGNPEPWKKYYAEDALYADEKGRSLNKTALVADITPMPKGYSGAIKIVRPQSRIFGDTAVLSYDLDETETIFGQNLKARYHETDTWLRRNGVWQIVAAQAFRYYEDPAIGKADPKKLPNFRRHLRVSARQYKNRYGDRR